MKKPVDKVSIIIAISVALMVGTGTAAYELRDSAEPNIAVELPTITSEEMPQGSVQLPLRLFIPILEVDTKIQHVGRTNAGLMGSPSNFKDVGWFREGTRPGDVGSAVIGGHLDNALGLAGVFKKLSALQIGDDVYVYTSSGEAIHFRVTRVVEYPYNHVPINELFEQKGGMYLNLVTCAGTWLQAQKTYDRRHIIYTERVKE